MYVLMQHIERYNSDNKNELGYIPLMARLSPCQLGALSAQSFVERMNSCAKLLILPTLSRMKHDLSNKLVILKMNREFMEYCRT